MRRQRSSSTNVQNNSILKLLDKLNREARQHRALLAKILSAVAPKQQSHSEDKAKQPYLFDIKGDKGLASGAAQR